MHILEQKLQESDRNYALRVIKENIINLELAPGCQISENELSTQLGLSRTPVREALIELSKVNIVEIRPQKRSVIAPIDHNLVAEARFVRNVLECAVVELVCDMATAEDIHRLDEIVNLQNFYLESNSCGSLLDMDNQFHQSLFEIAQKRQAFVLLQSMSIHFDRVRYMSLNSVKDLEIVQDHAAITNAIREKNPQEARQLMEVHLNRYKMDSAAIRARYPQYFI